MADRTVFTAESVTEGNSNKVADLLADSVLDAIVSKDRFARVSCKVLVSTGLVMVAGEVTTDAWVDIGSVVRAKLRDIGYNEPTLGFDASSCAVMNILEEQSEEIGLAVDRRGAGDQCTVIGYATDEGESLVGGTCLMPVPIFLAHQLSKKLAEVRKKRQIKWLKPDGKTGVCVEYEGEKPVRVSTVVVSAHHSEKVELDQVREELRSRVVESVLGPTGLMDDATTCLINPAGPFTRGGPHVDAGFTGLKTSVDAYGTVARQMDSGLSGKDPTKPGRSGSYIARYVAKNIVSSGLAHRCEVRLSYVIGQEKPAVFELDTFGTSKHSTRALVELVQDKIDLSIPGVVECFELRRPLYTPLACYGHFGRNDLQLPWESAATPALAL